MIGFKILSLFGLALSVSAQASFGAPENSAQILALLKQADIATIKSGQGAAAYTPGNQQAYQTLADQNAVLLQSWQTIITTAENSPGFYTPQGAQAIVSYLNKRLGPDTEAADLIYTNKRDVFIKGGFINYINPGLIKLRTAVDAAAAAVKQKTPSKYLTPMDLGFLIISQNYANTQEIQQFGPDADVFFGQQCTRPIPKPPVSGSGGGKGGSGGYY